MDKKQIFAIIRKIIIHCFGLGCTLGVVFAALFYIKYSFVDTALAKSDRYYINDIYDMPITQLADGKTFTQNFEAHGDIYGVQIRWHNLAQVQNGTALIQVSDGESGQVLASTTYNLQRIVNDVYNEIAFDVPYRNSEEGYQPYVLSITPAFDNPAESYLKIWGDSTTGTIAFGVLEYMVNPANVYGWFSLLEKVALAAVFAVYLVCFVLPLKKEVVYVVTLLAVSCLFTLVLPPYSSPDEEGHINTAYRIVNGWDGFEGEDFNNQTIYKRNEDKNSVFEEKYTTVLNYEYIYENLTAKSKDNFVRALPESWTVSEFTGSYLMGALGIKLGHILDLGYVPTMYLGRMMNLLLFAACLFVSIKITPVGKNIFMAVGMFPITLHIANSFSRDVFAISMAFLFTAYLLYLLKQQENYKWWQLGLLAVICALLAPSKFIYVTMCLGVLLLDITKVPLLNKIKWRIHPAVLLGIAVAVFVPVMAKIAVDTYPEMRWKIFAMAPLEEMLAVAPNHSFSLQHLIENPVVTAKLFINTIYNNGAYYIKSLAGGVLSYNSIAISDAFVIITLIMTVIASFTDATDSYTLKKREKITFVVLFGGVLALVLFMCVSWTFVYYTTLYGLQGKYLLPVLPMLLVAVKNKAITVNKDIFRPVCFAMAVTNIFVALNAFCVIMQR